MVTGDITPTHAPPCRLHYAAEMQTDQQPGQKKPPLTRDEGWATALGNPQFCIPTYECRGVSSRCLGFSPRGKPPSPCHPTRTCRWTPYVGSPPGPLLCWDPKVLHTGARCRGACPQGAKDSHSDRIAHADAKNPKQDNQNGCEIKMLLTWKLSSSPRWASPRTSFSAALLYLREAGRRVADLQLITLSLTCKQLIITPTLQLPKHIPTAHTAGN